MIHLIEFSILFPVTSCFGLFFYLEQKNRVHQEQKNSEELSDDQNKQSSLFNDDYLSLDNQFEIPIELFKRDGQTLGIGCIGFVQSGTLQVDDNEENNIIVAIKRARNDSSSECVEEIHKEIKVLASLAPHPNVLAFIGFVRLRSSAIVTELVDSGDLRSFLRFRQDIFEDQIAYSDLNLREKTDQFNNTGMSTDQRSLCTFDLVSFAYQIANGMEYLAGLPCHHRGLALQNVLVSHDNTIRIVDFGTAGRHGNNENYKCQIAEDQRLPIWWTAPEVWTELESSEKTDVFAFGVCLFELFSLGNYRFGYHDERILPFPEPEFCPPELYQFMLKCWDSEPTLRPTFTECVTFFGGFLDRYNRQLRQQIYGKLRVVSEWQKEIRNQVHGRNLIHPEIDVPVIDSE